MRHFSGSSMRVFANSSHIVGELQSESFSSFRTRWVIFKLFFILLRNGLHYCCFSISICKKNHTTFTFLWNFKKKNQNSKNLCGVTLLCIIFRLLINLCLLCIVEFDTLEAAPSAIEQYKV